MCGDELVGKKYEEIDFGDWVVGRWDESIEEFVYEMLRVFWIGEGRSHDECWWFGVDEYTTVKEVMKQWTFLNKVDHSSYHPFDHRPKN